MTRATLTSQEKPAPMAILFAFWDSSRLGDCEVEDKFLAKTFDRKVEGPGPSWPLPFLRLYQQSDSVHHRPSEAGYWLKTGSEMIFSEVS